MLLPLPAHSFFFHTHPLPPLPPAQKNFGRPVEWALVKDHAWSAPQLRKLEKPVDADGKPWPLDAEGKPVAK
jgi:hypothetical protein